MAHLRRSDGRLIELSPYCVVGRSPEAQIRLTSSAVSSEHAAFHWLEQTWHVRDLGSRNGTFVNGVGIDASRRVALSHGDVICFGDRGHPWRFEQPNTGNLAGLPTLVETSSVLVRTDLAQVELHLHVSPDTTDVSVSLLTCERSQRQQLGFRAGFHLLLFLAEARLEDRAHGVGSNEEGWRARDALLVGLRMTNNHLSVESHRLRQLFERHGVRDASSLIEMRRASKTVRLGVERVVVERARPGHGGSA